MKQYVLLLLAVLAPLLSPLVASADYTRPFGYPSQLVAQTSAVVGTATQGPGIDSGSVIASPQADAAPDFAAICAAVLDALNHRNWWLLASVVVSLITWALRAGFLSKLPGKLGLYFHDHPIAGYAAPFAVATALGGILSAFANGVPFSWSALLGEVIKVGAGAIAVFIGAQKVADAKHAGAEAAAGITTKQAALDELRDRVRASA